MDVYIAVISPRNSPVGVDPALPPPPPPTSRRTPAQLTTPPPPPGQFSTSSYEILLVSSPSSHSSSSPAPVNVNLKQIPNCRVPLTEPLGKFCLNYIESLTAPSSFSSSSPSQRGLKGHRALLIASGNSSHLVPSSASTFSCGTLEAMRNRGQLGKQNTQLVVCIPVSPTLLTSVHRGPISFLPPSTTTLTAASPDGDDDKTDSFQFHSLDRVIADCFNAVPAFADIDKHHLHELEKWLANTHSVVGGPALLYQPTSNCRIAASVISPCLTHASQKRQQQQQTQFQRQLQGGQTGNQQQQNQQPREISVKYTPVGSSISKTQERIVIPKLQSDNIIAEEKLQSAEKTKTAEKASTPEFRPLSPMTTTTTTTTISRSETSPVGDAGDDDNDDASVPTNLSILTSQSPPRLAGQSFSSSPRHTFISPHVIAPHRIPEVGTPGVKLVGWTKRDEGSSSSHNEALFASGHNYKQRSPPPPVSLRTSPEKKRFSTDSTASTSLLEQINRQLGNSFWDKDQLDPTPELTEKVDGGVATGSGFVSAKSHADYVGDGPPPRLVEDGPPPYQSPFHSACHPPYQSPGFEDRISILSSRLSSILEAQADTPLLSSTDTGNSFFGGGGNNNDNNTASVGSATKPDETNHVAIETSKNSGSTNQLADAGSTNRLADAAANDNAAADGVSEDGGSCFSKKSLSTTTSISSWLCSPESGSALECQKHLERLYLRRKILGTLEGWDRCDSVVVNPLFHTGLPFRPRVICVSNPFWRKGLIPDYSKISKKTATRCSGRDFPLHRAAYQGPSSEILRLIFQQGLSLSELDDANWAPLHHAAWAGNVATVETLLNPVPFFTQLRVEEEEGEEEEVFKRDHAGGKVTARNEAFVTNEGGKVVGSAKWIARGGKTSASLRQRDFAGSRFKDVRASLPRMHPHSASNTDQKHFENNINIAGNNNRSVINNNNVPIQSERAPYAHPPASFPDHFAASIDSMRRQRLYPGVTGCSPNIKNGNKATPLHLAALNGHEGVVQLLVDHPKIHLRAKNKEGKTALDLCRSQPMPEYQECARRIEEALRRPKPVVKVRLMDGQCKEVVLHAGYETTVNEINFQMAQMLHLNSKEDGIGFAEAMQQQMQQHLQQHQLAAPSSPRIFSVWICSKNLAIPLQPEARPMYLLDLWKVAIVPQFTNLDPDQVEKEVPELFYRRDAWLPVASEQKVLNRFVISLLFYEAYTNFIDGNLPCTEGDGVKLAALFLATEPKRDFAHHLQTLIQKEQSNLFLVIPKNLAASRAPAFAKEISREYQVIKSNLPSPPPSLWILQYRYLKFCWNLMVYGSRYFHGDRLFGVGGEKAGSPKKGGGEKVRLPVIIAVNDVGIHVLGVPAKNGKTSSSSSPKTPQDLLQTFPYSTIQLHYDFDKCRISLRNTENQKKVRSSPAIAIHSKQVQLIVDQYRLMQPPAEQQQQRNNSAKKSK